MTALTTATPADAQRLAASIARFVPVMLDGNRITCELSAGLLHRIARREQIEIRIEEETK